MFYLHYPNIPDSLIKRTSHKYKTSRNAVPQSHNVGAYRFHISITPRVYWFIIRNFTVISPRVHVFHHNPGLCEMAAAATMVAACVALTGLYACTLVDPSYPSSSVGYASWNFSWEGPRLSAVATSSSVGFVTVCKFESFGAQRSDEWLTHFIRHMRARFFCYSDVVMSETAAFAPFVRTHKGMLQTIQSSKCIRRNHSCLLH